MSGATGARGRSGGAGFRTARARRPVRPRTLPAARRSLRTTTRTRAWDPRPARERSRPRPGRHAAHRGRRRTCRRAHRAAEVEDERREAALARQLVPDGPQDRVVLAAAVSRMGVADHGRPARRFVGKAELALEANAVLGEERNGLHVCDDASHGGDTPTAWDGLHDPRPAAVAGRGRDRARGRGARLRGRLPAGDRRSGHARYVERARGGDRAVAPGDRCDPDAKQDLAPRGDGGRDGAGAVRRQAHPGCRHGRVGAGGARAARGVRDGDPRPGGRQRPRRRARSSALRSRADLGRRARARRPFASPVRSRTA